MGEDDTVGAAVGIATPASRLERPPNEGSGTSVSSLRLAGGGTPPDTLSGGFSLGTWNLWADQEWIETRTKIISRDGPTCSYCGKQIPQGRLHVDHVTPKSQGGDSDPGNLRVSCKNCNLQKGSKNLQEYRSYLSRAEHKTILFWFEAPSENRA